MCTVAGAGAGCCCCCTNRISVIEMSYGKLEAAYPRPRTSVVLASGSIISSQSSTTTSSQATFTAVQPFAICHFNITTTAAATLKAPYTTRPQGHKASTRAPCTPDVHRKRVSLFPQSTAAATTAAYSVQQQCHNLTINIKQPHSRTPCSLDHTAASPLTVVGALYSSAWACQRQCRCRDPLEPALVVDERVPCQAPHPVHRAARASSSAPC